MTPSAIEVFNSFRASMLAKNDDWMQLIAKDVSLVGPLAQVKGKEQFIAINQPFFASIRGGEIHQILEKDNYVITQISTRVEAPTGKVITLRVCEWYEIEAGKIASLEVFFDTNALLKEMSPA